MKIVYLSEMNFFSDKADKEYLDMGVIGTQMYGLGAAHYPFYLVQEDSSFLKKYDICIFIYSKKDPNSLTLIPEIKKYCKVVLNQEGPRDFWYDWNPIYQKIYIEAMEKCDMFFANNESDLQFFRGFIGDKVVLSPVSFSKEYVEQHTSNFKNEVIMLGGTMCKWYGGLSSYNIASKFNIPMIIPSMGRRVYGEEKLTKNTVYSPYISKHSNWINFFSSTKYLVHMMSEIGGGNLVLTASALGIPAIGNKLWDTQRICQPDLAIDIWEIEKGQKLLERLIKDKSFYSEMSKLAKENAHEYFEQEVVANIQKNNLRKIL